MPVFGLIGYPLQQSFSKRYFTEKFLTEGLHDCTFELFPLKHIREFPGVLQHNILQGLAVTIPHKEAVIPYLDSLDKTAEQIGAVNCITFLNGKLKGYNTDCIGFEKSLLPLLPETKTKALVLGTGGASKAVQYVLHKLDIPFLLVSRREKGDGIIAYEEIDIRIMNEYRIIINATPVGMYPKVDEMPDLPFNELTPQHLLYDLIYKPEQTKFLSEGIKKGAAIKNGYEMLIIQAEENWNLWKQEN